MKSPETTTPDTLELANRLRPVLLLLNRQLRRETLGLGITGGQASILHLIRTQPGIGMRELADREGMSAPAVSGYVDRLEAADLVTRTRSGEDRRRVGLSVSPSGLRALRALRTRRTAWLAARLDALDADSLAAIDAATGPLSRLLEATR